MNLAYESLIKKHNIDVKDLPKDARIGIDGIKKTLHMVAMLEKSGKKISQSVLDKITANDKWVTREIYDYLEGDDKNDDEIPNDASEIQKEAKEEAKKQEQDPIGFLIDEELYALKKENVETISFNDLKAKAPKTYNEIFRNYDADEDNGVETSNFSLVETETEKFSLKQK
jgi:uncharacterized protein (DUF1015 family)